MEDEEDMVLPSDLAQKIFEQAREQRNEVEGSSKDEIAFDENAVLSGLMLGGSDDEDDDASVAEGRFIDGTEEEEYTFEDEEALRAFMSGELSQRRTIADLIMEKLQQSEGDSKPAVPGQVRVDPKVVECYSQVGRMLSAYRSGKLPKAFKIIPALTNWEEVLYYTEPDKWSPNALRQATRLFASNLNPRMAQRFYNLVLLPRVRNEIDEKKKLHWSIYQALRKACYKPAAFYKGIILPLCEASSDCTLKEAAIVGSVIRLVSLPVLHSSAALLKMCGMPYTGAHSIFMRIIIEKKYALPYRVLDGLVKHFCSFANEKRCLPVLWHKCLLAFAQRYKTDLSAAQLESLKFLMRAQSHDLITPEIRNQLFGHSRDAKRLKPDVTMTQAVSLPQQQPDLVME
eukprot:c6942_g1_i1.p1 GENE.c6942_g1_i1~~c6942_g1_i1.p1  ORF type:complete len:440 (+),score=125.96 c6942_g1_i1:122-1321(+)